MIVTEGVLVRKLLGPDHLVRKPQRELRPDAHAQNNDDLDDDKGENPQENVRHGNIRSDALDDIQIRPHRRGGKAGQRMNRGGSHG